MTRLWLEGFETDQSATDLGRKYTAVNVASTTIVAGRRGGSALEAFTSSRGFRTPSLGNHAEWTVGIAIRALNIETSPLLSLYDGTTAQIGLRLTRVDSSDYRIEVVRGVDAIATSPVQSGSASTWVYLEARFVLDSEAGSFQVRRNGQLILTGVAPTIVSANEYASFVDFRIRKASGGTFTIDDIYVVNGDASTDGGHVGPQGPSHVVPIFPVSDELAEWTDFPATGVHFSTVDEVSVDDNTSYVRTAVDEAQDVYGFGDAGIEGQVLAIQLGAVARVESARAASLSPIVSSDDGFVVDASPLALSLTTYDHFSRTYATNPITGYPWAARDLDGRTSFGLEFGIVVGGAAARVTAFRAEVLVRDPDTVQLTHLAAPTVIPNLLRINWGAGVEVESAYQNDITTSEEDGTEERRGIHDRPIRTISVVLRSIRSPETWRVLANVLRQTTTKIPVPLYSDHARVTSASGTTITCPTAYRRFFAGQRIAIAQLLKNGEPDEGTIEYRTVGAVSDGSLTVTLALSGTFTEGARVWPMIDAEVDLDGAQRLFSAASGDVSLSVTEVIGFSALPPLVAEDHQEWPVFRGRSVFDVRPDWSSGMTISVRRAGRIAVVGRGRIVTLSEDLARFEHESPHTELTRAGVWNLLRFFDAHRGTRQSFWIVLPQALWSVVDVTTTYVEIDANGNLEDLEDFVEVIGIVRQDGSLLLRGVDSISDQGDTWRIVVDEDLPVLTVSGIRRLTSAHHVRFAEDRFIERWKNDECCLIQLRAIDLRGEQVVLIDDLDEVKTFGVPAEIPNLYVWFASEANTWHSDVDYPDHERSRPASRLPQSTSYDLTDTVDYWDDKRVIPGEVEATGSEFPKPYLERRSTTDTVGPFLAYMDAWKKGKGHPVLEFGGASGAEMFLVNDRAPCWSNVDGMTLVFVGRTPLPDSSSHLFYRQGVLEWGMTSLVMQADSTSPDSNTNASYSSIAKKAPRTWVLRWVPGSEVSIWRSGTLMLTKTVNVAASIDTTNAPSADDKVCDFNLGIAGAKGEADVGSNGFCYAFLAYRRALTDDEINDLGDFFQKAYKSKWEDI